MDESWYAEQEKAIEDDVDNVLKIIKSCISKSSHRINTLEKRLSVISNQNNDHERQVDELENKRAVDEIEFLKTKIKDLEEEIANNAKMGMSCKERGKIVESVKFSETISS